MVIHRAMRKYGWENFLVKTLAIANDWEYLCDLEKKAIVAFKTTAPEGYNSTEGGDGVIGFEVTDELREKLSSRVKAAFADPEMRARHKEGCLKESRRKLISEKLKLWNADPKNAESKVRNFLKSFETRMAVTKSRKISISCAACRSDFLVNPSDRHRKYCSQKCAAAGRVTGAILKCPGCKKEFHAKKSEIENRQRKYCSDVCKNAHMRGSVLNEYRGDASVSISCHGCEKEFTVPPWKAKRANRLFCTKECYVRNWHLLHP